MHRWQIATGIAKGIAFLHSQVPNPVMHRDLKPENILFADNLRRVPKLADFGTSRRVAPPRMADSNHTNGDRSARGSSVAGSREEMTADCTTPLFSAPEMLAQQSYDLSVDIWALGCCLCCLYLNEGTPYPNASSCDERDTFGNVDLDVGRTELEYLAQITGHAAPPKGPWLDMWKALSRDMKYPLTVSYTEEDAEQSILYANKAFCELTGYTMEELDGRSLRLLDGKGTEAEAKKQIHSALRQGQATTALLTSYNKQMQGSRQMLRIQPVVDTIGRHRYTVSLQVDTVKHAHLVDEFDKIAAALPTATGADAVPLDAGATDKEGEGAGAAASATSRTVRNDAPRKTLFARVMEGSLRPSLALAPHTSSRSVAVEMERTIGKCCRLDPTKRPAAKEVCDLLDQGMSADKVVGAEVPSGGSETKKGK